MKHREPGEALATRDGLPEALRVLLEERPREGWEGREGLDQMVVFWLDRHVMFRRLLAIMQEDTRALIGRDMDLPTFAPRLTRLGNHFLADLHAHHTIEDAHFFPALVGLDARIARGFDLLEADHEEIDTGLADFAGKAREVLDGGEAGRLGDELDRLETFLNRHLTDEEDLIVPLILKTGFQF